MSLAEILVGVLHGALEAVEFVAGEAGRLHLAATAGSVTSRR